MCEPLLTNIQHVHVDDPTEVPASGRRPSHSSAKKVTALMYMYEGLLVASCTCTWICIIESVDSISRDGPDVT